MTAERLTGALTRWHHDAQTGWGAVSPDNMHSPDLADYAVSIGEFHEDLAAVR